MTAPKPLLPLTPTERQCAIARAVLCETPMEGAAAACVWIFRLRGDWSRTPTAAEFASMLAELRRDPVDSALMHAKALADERDRYRELLERVVVTRDKWLAGSPVGSDVLAHEDAIDDARKALEGGK